MSNVSATEAYNQKKISNAISGMKIALLMPFTAITQNVLNTSVTASATASLSSKLIVSVIISITLIAMCDFFAGIFTLIYNISKGKGITEYRRMANLKVSWMMLLAAAFGGPLATGCWMAATPFCGLTTVAVVTSLGPILTAFVSRFFLKEKLNGRIYVGIAITVCGVIVSGWTGFSEGGSNFILGFILALMAPIGFTLEGQFSTYVGDVIDPNVGCGFYRCFGSSIIGLAAMATLSYATGNFDSFRQLFVIVFSHPMLALFVVLMGLLGAINYNAAYLAFNRTGPSRALAIDSSRPLWSIPLGYFFAALGVTVYSVNTLGVVGAVFAVCGLILIICKPSELVNLRSVE